MKWKKVAVDREFLSVDRHYFDIYLDEDGFGGNFIWHTGHTWRTPFSLVKDFLLRKKQDKVAPNQRNTLDERNFYFKYEDIHGVVDDDIHKMFEVLTNTELLKIFFRKIPRYETFSSEMKNKIGDKFHPKTTKVKPSLEQGY